MCHFHGPIQTHVLRLPARSGPVHRRGMTIRWRLKLCYKKGVQCQPFDLKFNVTPAPKMHDLVLQTNNLADQIG